MSDNGLTGIKKQWVGGDEVIISRAEYDALITERDKLKSQVEQLLGAMKLDGRFLAQHDVLMKAAAWVLNNCAADCPLVAALRAAGIQTEEP